MNQNLAFVTLLARRVNILILGVKESLSGVEGVRVALNTVLSELHKVLYKQLLAWLLQGNLYDPYQVIVKIVFLLQKIYLLFSYLQV